MEGETMAGMRMTTKAERNGFKSAATDLHLVAERKADRVMRRLERQVARRRAGLPPGRTKPMMPHHDDRRAARRTQRAARRITRRTR